MTGEVGQPRLLGRLVQFEQVVAVILLVLVLGLTFLQVVARFVFNAPFFWTEELARYSYVWLSFVAAVFVMAEQSHIAIRMFEGILSRRLRLAVNAFAMAAVVVACFTLAIGSFGWLTSNTGGHSAALNIPTVVFYGVVYVSFVAMGLHTSISLAQLLQRYRSGADLRSVGKLGETGL
jgi:TRAP-type C4-dicarboxylate transport system permease small subunit